MTKVTIDKFIEDLQSIKKELKDKPLKVVSENGFLLNPKIKIKLIDNYSPLDKSSKNVECLIISYED